MSEDFNPGKYEQPDYFKDEMKSARTGLGLLLLTIFTLGRSVQVFSRIPGTVGPAFLLAHLVSMFVQYWFYVGTVEHSGETDMIGIGWIIGAQFVWFAYGVCQTFRFRRLGIDVEFKDLGIGILQTRYPQMTMAQSGVLSDLSIAGAIMLVLFAFGSPISGVWYLVMIFALLFAHAWMEFRHRDGMQRMKDAKTRAQEWVQKLNQLNGR